VLWFVDRNITKTPVKILITQFRCTYPFEKVTFLSALESLPLRQTSRLKKKAKAIIIGLKETIQYTS
jgi:hypothetical protein